MSPSLMDVLSVLLRAAGLVWLLTAVGGVLSGPWEGATRADTGIAAGIRTAALAAIAALCVQEALEPARLAGDWSGITDPLFLSLALLCAGGAAFALKVTGLAGVALAAGRAGLPARLLALAGSLLALLSFLLVGHTTTHEPRALLGLLLLLHLAAVAFWLGALGPLIQVLRQETAARAGALVSAFSRRATRVVPALFLAAAGLAVALLPSPGALLTPYGRLLLTKLALFAGLLGLASLNKWRLGPAVAQGAAGAVTRLQRVIRVEQLLIAAVVLVTSVMTSWFSPDG